MSVTSHLKDLLIKMGGTPKNGDSTSVLIDKIEDVYDGSGSDGGSSGGSGILVANATWLLASNDPMREQYEAQAHEQDSEAVYHGRFVLDKTWNEISNAPFAVIRIQSNETDVDMAGNKIFNQYPAIALLPIDTVGKLTNDESIAYCVATSNFNEHNSGRYYEMLPSYDQYIEGMYGVWMSNAMDGYPSSPPFILYPGN